MHFLLHLIFTYGYLIIFLGTLLEGETIVALGGFIAYQGHLHLWVIIPIAVLGAMAGDQFFFFLGRFKGRKMLKRHPEWHRRVEKVHTWMTRYRDWLIFGSRFLYGFRAILPIVLGTSKISAVRYVILDFLGAIAWAILFGCGGYMFGDVIERFLGHAKRLEGSIVLSVLFLVAVIQLVAWIKRRTEKDHDR